MSNKSNRLKPFLDYLAEFFSAARFRIPFLNQAARDSENYGLWVDADNDVGGRGQASQAAAT